MRSILLLSLSFVLASVASAADAKVLLRGPAKWPIHAIYDAAVPKGASGPSDLIRLGKQLAAKMTAHSEGPARCVAKLAGAARPPEDNWYDIQRHRVLTNIAQLLVLSPDAYERYEEVLTLQAQYRGSPVEEIPGGTVQAVPSWPRHIKTLIDSIKWGLQDPARATPRQIASDLVEVKVRLTAGLKAQELDIEMRSVAPSYRDFGGHHATPRSSPLYAPMNTFRDAHDDVTNALAVRPDFAVDQKELNRALDKMSSALARVRELSTGP